MEQTITDANSGRVIPSAYANLGVTFGFNPPAAEKIIMLVLGLSGAGKTTFVSSIPSGIVLSFQEHGASSIIGGKAPRVYLPHFTEYANIRNRLITDGKAGTSPFACIIIDTVDEWYDLLCEKVVKDWNERYNKNAVHIGEVGSEGKGYGDAAALMKLEIKALEAAGYGVIMTGHYQEKTISVGDERRTVLRPILVESAFKVVKTLTYIKAAVQTQVITQGIKILPGGKQLKVTLPEAEYKRIRQLVVVSDDSSAEIKKRLPHLQDIIELPMVGGWDAFKDAYNNAVELGKQASVSK